MPVTIPLQAAPNQKLTVVLSGSVYTIAVKAISSAVAVTVERDNEVLISSVRAVSGTPILPYQYLEEGNFIFVSGETVIPEYEEFGISQSLLYFTRDELEALRNGA